MRQIINMNIKRETFFVWLLMTWSVAHGQSDIFLTQQWFSRINMNPAATGNSNNVDVFLLNRQQWVGFDNAPRTSVLNAHSYFNSIQSGLGVNLMFDRIGVSHQTLNAMLSYAYHIDVTDDVLFSLGLSGGLYNNNWDPRRNTLPDETIEDEYFAVEKSSRAVADFHTGMELRIYGLIFGASVTHLLSSSPENSLTGKPGREIYVYLRYRFAINPNVDIAPCIMYRNGNRTNFFDYNLTGYYKRKHWAGFSLRPKSSFAVMLGTEYNMFRFGYAYDRSIGGMSSIAANTHEIMISVRIQKPQHGRKTTRFLD